MSRDPRRERSPERDEVRVTLRGGVVGVAVVTGAMLGLIAVAALIAFAAAQL